MTLDAVAVDASWPHWNETRWSQCRQHSRTYKEAIFGSAESQHCAIYLTGQNPHSIPLCPSSPFYVSDSPARDVCLLVDAKINSALILQQWTTHQRIADRPVKPASSSSPPTCILAAVGQSVSRSLVHPPPPTIPLLRSSSLWVPSAE